MKQDEGSIIKTYLARSTDLGKNWVNLPNNFSRSNQLTEETLEPIFRMTVNNDRDRLYAVGFNVLAESLDGGQTWESIAGLWDQIGTGMASILYVDSNPLESAVATLLYGGQGAIENGTFY